MAQSGKVMPNLDQNSTKILNLIVLQRIDPFVEEILMTAAHVTFYEFNIDLSQWSRKDVEGSLFVVKRNTQPRFQFIVMNRRSTENLVENLLGDFEYEVQVPYLLYRNAIQEVNGIWFYNARECEEVANLFSRILNAYSKVPTKSKISSSKRLGKMARSSRVSIILKEIMLYIHFLWIIPYYVTYWDEDPFIVGLAGLILDKMKKRKEIWSHSTLVWPR